MSPPTDTSKQKYVENSAEDSPVYASKKKSQIDWDVSVGATA